MPNNNSETNNTNTTNKSSLHKRLESLLAVVGKCLHTSQDKVQKKKDRNGGIAIAEEEDAQNPAVKEKSLRMRDAIKELVDECKRVTLALAEQVVEGRATIEVIE